ncbi:hypothetical protein Tco_0676367 [Tanacetum coccineum]
MYWVVVLGNQNIGEGSGSVSEGYGNVTKGQSVQGRRTEHSTIRHDSFVPISASAVISLGQTRANVECCELNIGAQTAEHISLEVDAPYPSVVPSERTKRKLMYDSVSVLEVGSSTTTRNRRTGDDVFPGDICRWGIVAKRKNWVLRGTNSRRIFSQRFRIFSPATCRQG